VLGEHTKEIVKIQYIKKNNMMFKEGDKYIHFSKYGSINKGEVKSCGSTTVIDAFRCVTYKQYHIISTKGILLNLDGTDGRVYKVEDEFTPEEGENFINLMTKAKEIKSKRIEELHRNGVEL
jgi:hypothetical protein